jgi:hypothetical protein
MALSVTQLDFPITLPVLRGVRLRHRFAHVRGERRPLRRLHRTRPDDAVAFTESISNASFGIYFPKFTGTIYELLSAPISFFEMILGYVGAAATKSTILGLIILTTASFFVPVEIRHPLAMVTFLLLTWSPSCC